MMSVLVVDGRYCVVSTVARLERNFVSIVILSNNNNNNNNNTIIIIIIIIVFIWLCKFDS